MRSRSFFLALGFGHDDDRAVALGIADHCQADSGIAGGALDNQSARSQLTAGLGILDDRQRGAVLDRATRIHEFGLAIDVAAGQLRDGTQPDQRRVTNRVDEFMIGWGRGGWICRHVWLRTSLVHW